MIEDSLKFEILSENSEYLIMALKDRGFESTDSWSKWKRGEIIVEIKDQPNISFVFVQGKGAREMATRLGFNVENDLNKK